MMEKKYFKTQSIFLLEFLYEFYFYLQIVSVLRSIHQKYKDLDGLIKKNCNIMSKKLTKELIKMERIIRVNENYVADFNTIFGWPLFLFLCSSLTNVLGCINVSLVQYYSTKFAFDSRKISIQCVFALVYLTSLLVIVNLCDKIEKATDKVAKLCYSYQENFAAFPNVREELFILARCAKNHKPSFTAGFYTFNRPTLTSLLVIVNLCDKIEKATDKVAKLCYSYQENFAAFPNVREELFILARCAKNHKPSFTAGFYTFNRPTLVGLLAGTISYTIIIVQFNINKN
ncbi:unnamed protein product [Brassicogethes aeneus]|uniref:Gustatory receptor n=1 Tax=Brassicogethes aeneus TaxID=1431903 RepID=A0A9P0AVC4_BRAAE|nr:unnamed protein product [Brassicogethes aeneus]